MHTTSAPAVQPRPQAPQQNRRRWLVSTAIAAGCWAGPRVRAQPPRSANAELRLACIGVGGKGSSNLTSAAKAGRVVGLCDVDEHSLGKAAEKHPQAQQAFDYRKLLEEQAKAIDVVVISTPDHSHAAIALMAMRNGKHVYCEKPLCKYLSEARRLAETARAMQVVTQMGNQGSAHASLRTAVEQVRRGLIGDVREVHVWTNRPTWPTGPGTVPKLSGEAPKHLHWNEFVGPAEMTPYSSDYHPFKWRGWWHYGNGALGDMAAHGMNAAFHAFDLRNPATVQADHTGHDGISFPKSSTIRWRFPATPKRGEVSMFWYDGGRKPDAALFGGVTIGNGGCLLVGSQGSLLSNGDYNDRWVRIPSSNGDVLAAPPELLACRAADHFEEFVLAIRDGGACWSNFQDTAGPFMETVLLGNLALKSTKAVEWDSAKLSAVGQPELASSIQPVYRSGYDL